MVILSTEINKLAGDIGVTPALDGILDKEADQYVGGTESTGSNAGNEGVANTVEDGMVNQGQFSQLVTYFSLLRHFFFS